MVAEEVLAKHDENYMPPEAADALKKAKAMEAADALKKGGVANAAGDSCHTRQRPCSCC